MFPRQKFGSLYIAVCRDGYDFDSGLLSDRDLRRLAVEFSDELGKLLPGVKVIEFMFTTEQSFYVVLEGHVRIGAIRSKLPGMIARCPVGYMNDAQIQRHSWAHSRVKRLVDPGRARGAVEEILEGGCGHYHKDPRLVTSDEKLKANIVHFNHPFTGYTDGVIVMQSVRIGSASPADAPAPHLVYLWAFHGQEEDNDCTVQQAAHEGAWGSAVLGDEGVVRGFYHYHVEEGPWVGFTVSVSASEVSDALAKE